MTDLLRPIVFQEFKIFFPEILDDAAFLIPDNSTDFDQLGFDLDYPVLPPDRYVTIAAQQRENDRTYKPELHRPILLDHEIHKRHEYSLFEHFVSFVAHF